MLRTLVEARDEAASRLVRNGRSRHRSQDHHDAARGAGHERSRFRRREASCGTVSIADREGTRIGRGCLARMSEAGMTGLTARLLSEVARTWHRRPDLVPAAAAQWHFVSRAEFSF